MGSYLLRSGLHDWVLLEAPHSDDDLYTGRIVRNLFLRGYFAGAGFNSLSRWSVDRQARYGDFARREDTAFAAFAVAFLAEHPGGTVVQIHGFDAEKRGEASFADADIVVSEGTDAPGPRTHAFRDCLDRLLPGRVLLYPEDTRELGGTRNATGQIVRQGGGYFLHLELSLNLRSRLRRDSGSDRRLFRLSGWNLAAMKLDPQCRQFLEHGLSALQRRMEAHGLDDLARAYLAWPAAQGDPAPGRAAAPIETAMLLVAFLRHRVSEDLQAIFDLRASVHRFLPPAGLGAHGARPRRVHPGIRPRHGFRRTAIPRRPPRLAALVRF